MIIQYRRVFNDVRVGEWRDWNELGKFTSIKTALETMCVSLAVQPSEKEILLNNFIDVSMNYIGIYEFRNLSFDSSYFDGFQYRFIEKLNESVFYQFTFSSRYLMRQFDHVVLNTEDYYPFEDEDSPWKIGLNEKE